MESNSEGDYHLGIFNEILNSIAVNPITPELILSLIALVFLLIGSALMSGSEVAFFSIDSSDRVQIKEKSDKTGNRILNLLEQPRLLLATILIANNFFNVSIIILSYFIINGLFEFDNPLTVFLVEVLSVTFIIVLFGEVIPKVYANYNNIRFSRLMSSLISGMKKLFRPLSLILVNSTGFLEKRLAKHKVRQATKEEIDTAIDIATEDNVTEEEKDILKGIVKFGDITVKQIMRSRLDIVSVDIKDHFKSIFNTVRDSGFSRIPAIEETLDDIKGVLYAKDLLNYLDQPKDFKWQNLLRPVFFVPENKKIEDLLKEFQTKRIHISIAVDEYGGTAGIVTLEDIMEEIIGEIKDEYDHLDELEYKKLNPTTYIFEGKILINDLCRVLDISPDIFEKVMGDSDSLAGLMLELFQKIPGKNESVQYKGYQFVVMSASNKRIQKVKVVIP